MSMLELAHVQGRAWDDIDVRTFRTLSYYNFRTKSKSSIDTCIRSVDLAWTLHLHGSRTIYAYSSFVRANLRGKQICFPPDKRL
jgi:hypothetical protein